MKKELEGLEEGPKAEILKNNTKKISNWKTPGHNGIYGFWFKKFTSIHIRLALEMNRCLQGAHVLKWMTKGKITLIQKDPLKGTTPNNYRPITYLTMMWKILTAQIREEIYYSLTIRKLFPEEPKKMPQRIQKHRSVTLHRSAHPKQEQDQMEKSSYGMD